MVEDDIQIGENDNLIPTIEDEVFRIFEIQSKNLNFSNI